MINTSEKSVLFIVDHLNGGGAESITIQLAAAMFRQKIRVGILILQDEKSRMIVPDGIEKIVINIPEKLIYGNLWKPKKYPISIQEKIQKSVNKFNADIVIIGFWNGHWVNQFLTAKHMVNWIHGDMLYLKTNSQWKRKIRDYMRSIRYPLLFKKIFNGRDIVVVNNDLASHYQKIIPKARIKVLHNGIDQHTLKKDLCPNPDQKWDVVFVGRFSPEKQPDHTIHAFAKSGLLGRLAMVGDGSMKNQLVELANTLNVSDRIDFLGWLDQPALIIQQSRCLIVSSRMESFGLVIAEAITLGVPVVAYAVSSGVKHQLASITLQQGLVEAQNLEQLSSTLAQVVKTPYPITAADQDRLSIEHMVSYFS